MKIDSSIIYSIVLASCVGIYLLWGIIRSIRRQPRQIFRVLPRLKKTFRYMLVMQRHPESDDVSFLVAIIIFVYVAANIGCLAILAFHKQTRKQISSRSTWMFNVNVLPLYLGSRTNIALDTLFSLPLRDLRLLHRWIGRVCLIHAIVHMVTQVTMLERSLNANDYLVSII